MSTIVALGGGGFSMATGQASAIDAELLAMTGKDRPRVCFIPTASGDSITYGARFMSAFAEVAVPSVLGLFGGPVWGQVDPAHLLEQDLIYVGGGSTANLLAIWRVHGLPEVLAEAARRGTILAGISAGANCWFEQCSTDSFATLAPLRDGLGMLPGSVCPHYLGEADRRDAYLGWVSSGDLLPGWAIDDYSAVVFRDGEFVEAIGEQADHPVYRVDLVEGQAVEVAVEVRQLEPVANRDVTGCRQ